MGPVDDGDPVALLKSLKNSIFGGDGSGTTATGGLGRALTWARSQAGKPYQWGGAGNPSFDCSGFMSSIQKVILGQVPRGRLWSTFSFQGSNAPAGWVRNLRSPFQIGITNDGVGHTAGTPAGVNVESRAGMAWNRSRFAEPAARAVP
ncbi:NlpC/P60 family protein [Streptomyces atratus]|uniref:NlpC/P60 family protein n=1 Tax=Streptomyces atratus TaxID=1893 RepID=UPI0033EBCF5B